MTTTEAKAIIRRALAAAGKDHKLTARTVSFQDLARADCVFVRVHGWTPDPFFEDLERTARAHGFRVEVAR